MNNNGSENNTELEAFGTVLSALKGLEHEAQLRVIQYTIATLNVGFTPRMLPPAPEPKQGASDSEFKGSFEADLNSEEPDLDLETGNELLASLSEVAKKWMRRNAVSEDQLTRFFSIGFDDIDLVAPETAVPGSTMKDKIHSVLLLKGIAAYLGTGVPIITDDNLRQTCLHYNCFDATNYAKYIKAFGSEITGNKQSGYTLNARGMTQATEIIKKAVADTIS
jgi:hypothetical protein